MPTSTITSKGQITVPPPGHAELLKDLGRSAT